MTPELGLCLLKLFLLIDALTYCSSPTASTLITHSEPNKLINTSTSTESQVNTTSTLDESFPTSVSSQTFKSPTTTDLMSTTITSTSTVVDSTTTAKSNTEEITKPAISHQPPQQNLQLFPWNSIWNSAQSIWSILPPNWWPYTTSINQHNSLPSISATPVASLTVTFGKTTVNNKGISGSNSIIGGGGGGIGLFGCPPPIVISSICPEATCNCQCDDKKNKNLPSVEQVKQKNSSIQKIIMMSSTSTPSTSSPPQLSQTKQPKQQHQYHQQDSTKFILPFQSLQDFFLKPVQMISRRAAGHSIYSSEIDE